MRIVTFNAWVGQRPRALRKNLERLVDVTERPEILAVQEAKRWDGTIPGYERVAWDTKGAHEDTGNGVILVRRRGVEIYGRRFLHVDGPWWEVVNHDKMHPPRLYPGVGIETREGRCIVLNVHRVPSRHVNSEAWAAEHRDLRAWAGRRAHPFAMVGDWNGRESDRGPFSISTLAEEIGGKAHLRGIDGAITRGFKVTHLERLDRKFGSDAHRPVVIDLEWKE